MRSLQTRFEQTATALCRSLPDKCDFAFVVNLLGNFAGVLLTRLFADLDASLHNSIIYLQFPRQEISFTLRERMGSWWTPRASNPMCQPQADR